MALKPKERRFASEYLIDQDGTKSAERAGYKGTAAVLQVTASRLRQKPAVAELIEKGMTKIEEKNITRADEIENEMWAMAQADIRGAFNPDGTPKKMHAIPDDVAKAIISIEVDSNGDIQKFRFVEKGRLYELLGKRHRMFTDLHEHSTKNGKPLGTLIDLSGVSDKVLEKLADMVDVPH